jgi:SEC-C motif-containing protein
MSSSPADLILQRCRAFVEGDFGFIWDIHHPESFFRRLYPDRSSYLDYAGSTLLADFTIRECRILQQQEEEGEARVIYYLDILFKGERRESFELVWLRRLDGHWRYFATQKLDRQEFPGEVEAIGWADFEQVTDKIVF